MQVYPILYFKFIGQVVDQRKVEIFASQERVAVR